MKIDFNITKLYSNKIHTTQSKQRKTVSFTSAPDKFVKQTVPVFEEFFKGLTPDRFYENMANKEFASTFAKIKIPKEKIGFLTNFLNEIISKYIDRPVVNYSFPVTIYKNALENNNVDLIKILADNIALRPFDKKIKDDADCQGGLFDMLINSENPEIRNIFSQDVLNKIATKNGGEKYYLTIYFDPMRPESFNPSLFKLFKARHDSLKFSQERSLYINAILDMVRLRDRGDYYNTARNSIDNRLKLLAELPVTFPEANYSIFESPTDSKLAVPAIQACRIDNLFAKHGDDVKDLKVLSKIFSDENMHFSLLLSEYKSGKTLLTDLASIPVTEQNKTEMAQIVQTLSSKGPLFMPCLDADINKPKLDFLREAGLLAAKNNNIDLLELIKDQHYGLNNVRNWAKTAKLSPEMHRLIDTIGYHDEKLLYMNDTEEIIERLKSNPQIDINAKNIYGVSLLLRKLSRFDIDPKLVDYLKSREDLDWNTTDRVGRNLLEVGNDLTVIFDIVKDLPKGKFNINHVNSLFPEKFRDFVSPFARCFSENCGEDLITLLSFSDFGKNYQKNVLPLALDLALCSKSPYQFDYCLKEYPELFKLEGYEGVSYIEYLAHLKPTEIEAYGNVALKKKQREGIDIVKKFYEEEGIFPLDYLHKISQNIEVEKLSNTDINDIGDRFAHFLPDIYPQNKEEINMMREIVDTLKKGNYDFSTLNCIGQSAFQKAVEAENIEAIKLLKDCSRQNKDMFEILKIVLNSNNSELKALFQ